MWLTLFFGALIALFACDFIRKRRSYQILSKSGITGPTSLPVLGCGLEALQLGAESKWCEKETSISVTFKCISFSDLIEYVGSCFEKYGNTFRMWILSECQVYTKDPRHFEAILSSTTLLEKGGLYQFLRPFLNDGLLLSVGRKWHSRRKIFTKAFHFTILEHFMDIMDKQSSVLVEKLQPFADGEQVVDMLKFVSLAALDIITGEFATKLSVIYSKYNLQLFFIETAMGVQVNAQSDPEFPYIKALKR